MLTPHTTNIDDAPFASTPRYVLMQGANAAGPTCTDLQDGKPYTAVFGFADQRSYDRFRRNGESGLKPYPLVSGYLRRMNSQPGLHLVVLDAAGPSEPCFRAATAEAVLKAIAENARSLTPTIRLESGQVSGVYEQSIAADALDRPLPASVMATSV